MVAREEEERPAPPTKGPTETRRGSQGRQRQRDEKTGAVDRFKQTSEIRMGIESVGLEWVPCTEETKHTGLT
jgi:hypothetical protein